MQSAFGTVVFVVCGVGILGALIALAFNGRAWDEYGKNHLLLDTEHDRSAPRGSAAAIAERDDEIRQTARGAQRPSPAPGRARDRHRDRAEKLTLPAIDAELRQEIRDLVVARNHRRARQGKPPLDIETEVEREIAGLHGI